MAHMMLLRNVENTATGGGTFGGGGVVFEITP